MLRAIGMRSLVARSLFVGALVAALSAGAFSARADTVPPGTGDGSVGHRLASEWCRGCHAIEPSAVNTAKPAPDFVAVANLPATTELSLKVFLRSNHKSMPNFIIRANDINDIVAYILSLKRQ